MVYHNSVWGRRRLCSKAFWQHLGSSIEPRRRPICNHVNKLSRDFFNAKSAFHFNAEGHFTTSRDLRYFSDFASSRAVNVESNTSTEPNDNEVSTSGISDELDKETTRLLAILGGSETDADGNVLSQITFQEIDQIMEKWSNQSCDNSGTNSMNEAKKSESLLLAMEQNLKLTNTNNGKKLVPDTVSYNRVLHAYAMSGGGSEAAEHAQSILDRMLENCREYESMDHNDQMQYCKPPEPSVITFNTVINAWAKSGTQISGSWAEQVFASMEEWYYECQEKRDNGESSYNGALPNSRTFSGVMDAWAQNSANINAGAERVLAILEHMVDKRRRLVRGEAVEGVVIKPNVVMFNSAIHAWANAGKFRRGAERAEELLKMLEHLDSSGDLGLKDENDEDDVGLKPNTRTLSLVIDAWARCNDPSGGAAKFAQDKLDLMENLYRQGSDVKPNYVSFTACITAWARSRLVPNAAERAEAIFDRMRQLSQELNDTSLRPTVTTGNAVITAWARSRRPDSASNAERVLDKLEENCRPNIYSYNSVMDAYAKKGWVRSSERLLQKMKELSENGDPDVRPSLITYNSYLNALSKGQLKGNGARKAEAFLKKMENMDDIQPDLRSYSAVIDCWAHSGEPAQAKCANALMRRVLDLYERGIGDIRPDLMLFTRLINACAKTNGNQRARYDALKIALQAFEDLKKSPQFGSPDSRCFGTLMTAISRCSSDKEEATRLLQAVLKQCSNAGQVNDVVLKLFLRNVPPKVRDKFISNGIPAQWSENVPNKHRPRSLHA